MYRNQHVEAQTGVEPVHSGFADRRVSPSPLRLMETRTASHLIILLSINIVNIEMEVGTVSSLSLVQDNVLRSPSV